MNRIEYIKFFRMLIVFHKQLFNLSLAVASCISLAACAGGSSPSPTPTPSPSPSPAPTFCELNVGNFTIVENTSLYSNSDLGFDPIWGPALLPLAFPSNLSSCQSSTSWQQQRVVQALLYWVGQKVNYCHHHVPTWYPEFTPSGATNPEAKASFESCSMSTDVMPPIPTESLIRWNYSGTGAESATAWYNINSGKAYATGNYGYGLDCSDYTKLVYDFAESIMFNSGIQQQAGQNTAQSNLAPNMSGFVDDVAGNANGTAAGSLVCADGSLAPSSGATNTSCNAHGGYISVFTSSGGYNANGVTDAMLNNLQPGDLLFIAGLAYDYPTTAINPQVTHVIVWTGQKIGSSSLISESMIAPETDIDSWGFHHAECDGDFWSASNNIGNWIISDSHYQGPDFRAFTNCFYRNQVWGVRRVLQN